MKSSETIQRNPRGPGWDWTTLSLGCISVSTPIQSSFVRLEEFVKANPSSADGRFVLAYHYLTCGSTEAARKQYEEVVKLMPNDQLSAQLLKLVGGDPTEPSSKDPTPQPPDAVVATQNEPSPPASIDATQIVGKWTARRDDGSTFGLDLTHDSKFTWSFAQGSKKQEFGGKYSVDGLAGSRPLFSNGPTARKCRDSSRYPIVVSTSNCTADRRTIRASISRRESQAERGLRRATTKTQCPMEFTL